MGVPRRALISIVLASGTAAAPRPAIAVMVNGCNVVLQNDLKRQDLAAAIHLHYYTAETRPQGITRRVSRGTDSSYHVEYFDPSGAPITDPEAIARYDALAIPPAYDRVWISPDPDSHVLAIGSDARGRLQYAYHPRWIAATAETKGIRLSRFSRKIARVRKTMEKDLRSPGITRRRLLAALATLLETGSIRVGTERYVETNGSYGLTTLLHRHVKVDGSSISFDFVGKEGIPHRFEIENSEAAAVVGELLRRPGPKLFEYVDESGALRGFTARDVTDYLEEISGGERFTAKDFRTWEGTTAAARKLLELGPAATRAEAEANVKAAAEYAASILRNQPGTARAYYINPLVLETYLSGTEFREIASRLPTLPNPDGLAPEELLVLELLAKTNF